MTPATERDWVQFRVSSVSTDQIKYDPVGSVQLTIRGKNKAPRFSALHLLTTVPSQSQPLAFPV